MASALPEAIGRFRIIQGLGEGGMGRVYLGRDPDPNIGRLVAIKLLREGFDNPEFRERFSREAKAASGFHHPNIVTVFETGTHDGQPFIVMEHIQGGTLGELIRRRVPLSLDRKLSLMEELFAGLHYAHKRNVVHRDIKPANIMIDDDGVLRILDFGIARFGADPDAFTQADLTRTGTVIGTLNYIAPEQLDERVIDGRADMFSAGAVFYELLSYQRAFPGDPPAIFKKIFLQDPEPLEKVCPGIDAGLVDTVNRCLRKEPDHRFADCSAVRQAIGTARRRIAARTSDTSTVALVTPPHLEEDRTDEATTLDSGNQEARALNAVRTVKPTVRIEPAAATRDAVARRRPPLLVATFGAVLLVAGFLFWRYSRIQPVVERPSSAASETVSLPTPAPPLETVSPASTPQDTQETMTRQLADFRKDARDRWDRGEVGPALSSLQSALTLNPGDPDARALAEEFVGQARARSARAMVDARDAGSTDSPSFSSARMRDAEGARLARTGQATQAAQAYLEAATLFTKVASEPRPPAAGASTAVPAAAAAPQQAAAAPQQTAGLPLPAQTQPQAPESRATPEVPSPEPQSKPERTTASPPPPVVPAGADDDAAIRDVLRRYKAAYESLDPGAVQAVFPSIKVASLTTSFKNYVSVKQAVDIQKIQIAADGRTATVTGSISNAPVLKVGHVAAETRRAVFSLTKTASGWVIAALSLT